MKKCALFGLVLMVSLAYGQVTEVDFLKGTGGGVNGAGPLLVRVDAARNRIVLVQTVTSSVSLIDGASMRVTNIPISTRVPQYLKNDALALRGKTGDAYVIGEKSLHVLFFGQARSVSFDTKKQYEMVAVEEESGNALLVGRASTSFAFLDLKKGSLRFIEAYEMEEPNIYVNASPMPPVRKCAFDSGLGIGLITDGFTNTLLTVSAGNGKILSRRAIPCEKGARWHWAGYNASSHALYAVIETQGRNVVQAVRIDARGTEDRTAALPGYTEGVGVNYNPARDEVYIPYDNHPVVHVVDFGHGGEVTEIKIPAYGNDASAIDLERDKLYVASWAFGEIDVIDLKSRTLERRVPAGVLPHMFSMDFNPVTRDLYVPLGATAVNGSHGAAVTVFDTEDFGKRKIVTGWAPVDLVQIPGDSAFIVFNSEDAFAVVDPSGVWKQEKLPVEYPRFAAATPAKNIILSYGPHQSYWPTVYIWAAKNGLLEMEPKRIEVSGGSLLNFQYFDRRIPRLAQGIVLDKKGGLWALQNSWGEENLMTAYFPEGIRMFGPMTRIAFEEKIDRETLPRILKYDEAANLLYLVKLGEKEEDPGKCLIIDAETQKLVRMVETGITPTSLAFDSAAIYITNFDSHTLTRIDKKTYAAVSFNTGRKPLRVAEADGIYVLNHGDNTLQRFGRKPGLWKLKTPGAPDGLFCVGSRLVITSHAPDALYITAFDPATQKFTEMHRTRYPFGETTFDTNNSSFYTRGQFGDAIFDLNRFALDDRGRLWVTDFLAGKVFIIEGF